MSFTILNANAKQIPLADKSVQCVVTSPPYWGLRDYGTVGQIGLEPTPEEYVAKIVAVFAEVWRVLRDDGTCWVNLGDSYAQGGKHRDEHEANIGEQKRIERQKIRDDDSGVYAVPTGWGKRGDRAALTAVNGLKPKDLAGTPWRVAFALQAAGWYLRSDIIWSKPNPMPESVTDRPTKAHEYIFLLTKRERYYFDQDAVREKADELTRRAMSFRDGGVYTGNRSHDNGADNSKDTHGDGEPQAGRNIRTVWEIATQPYPNAHFATFPEEIAIRCIKAGTSEKGACAKCGAPWERVTEREKPPDSAYNNARLSWTDRDDMAVKPSPIRGKASGQKMQDWLDAHPTKTLGWQPTCNHDAPTVPCIVLDPFSGAGTVPLVADKLNRRGIGLELKADYCRMASRRCYDDAPLLAVMEG